mgnify:CR=1 FL=1|jgi:hypothetical protein
MHKSGLTVKKQGRQPIDRSWKDTSLEWADPTAADRTRPRRKPQPKPQLKPKMKPPAARPGARSKPQHGIGDFLPGGMARAVRKSISKLSPKYKRKTAKNPLAVDIQGKGSKPTSTVREQQKAEARKKATVAARKKYLAKSKAKEKPIQKFETIEAEGGGKVKYRSIGGKVTNGNDITRMVYD